MEVRTRFAPSPTGYMHIGNLRTALYTYLIARKNKGKFILRIEDTDQGRYVEGATDVIYRTLRTCGLNWDEGPDIGGVPAVRMYRAREWVCSRSTPRSWWKPETHTTASAARTRTAARIPRTDLLPRTAAPAATWMLPRRRSATTPANPALSARRSRTTGTTTFHDEIYGDITVENIDLDDQVLLKSDGMPTYNFANVVDDHTMGITHVVRGNEYLSSAPKYNLLYAAFGWEPPIYIHVEHIMRDATHKLSKRDGDASFEDFRAKGYLTEAILNYILLLGWAPKGEQEIFTLDEMIEAFDLSGISKSPAIFDPLKLTAINAVYIRNLPLEKFVEYAEPWIRQTCKRTDIDLPLLCAGLQPRTEVFNDIPERVDFIDEMPEYSIDMYVSKKMKTTPQTSLEALQKLIPVIEDVEDFTAENIHDALFKQIEADGVKNGLYLYPLRVALSGKAVTPGGGVELAKILGKQDTLARMRKAVEKLTAEIG